jgi:hypothetical protein
MNRRLGSLLFCLLSLSVCSLISACKKDVPENALPAVNAGKDTTFILAATSDTIKLSGSATDADGTIESYLWSQVSGPSYIRIVNPASPTTIAIGAVAGSYVFQLSATDNKGATASKQVNITVNVLQPASPNFDETVKLGLWAYYPFTNQSFGDSSGNNRPMRGVNGIQFGSDRNNIAGSSLAFDGVNDYSVVDAGVNFPDGDFTVSLWMHAQRTINGRIFVKGNYVDAKGVTSTFGFDDDNQTNKLLFTVNNSPDLCSTTPANTELTYLNSNVALLQNQWYYVVVSHAKGIEKCFINGQLVATMPSIIQRIRNCTTAPFYFGIWWLQDLRPFFGRLDNVRIYTRELSDGEMQYLYNNYR